MLRALNETRGTYLARRVEVADSSDTRTKGLLGRSGPRARQRAVDRALRVGAHVRHEVRHRHRRAGQESSRRRREGEPQARAHRAAVLGRALRRSSCRWGRSPPAGPSRETASPGRKAMAKTPDDGPEAFRATIERRVREARRGRGAAPGRGAARRRDVRRPAGDGLAGDAQPPRPRRRRDRHRQDEDAAGDRRAAVGGGRAGVRSPTSRATCRAWPRRARRRRRCSSAPQAMRHDRWRRRPSRSSSCASAGTARRAGARHRVATSARCCCPRCSASTRRRSRPWRWSSTTPTTRACRCSTWPTCARCSSTSPATRARPSCKNFGGLSRRPPA